MYEAVTWSTQTYACTVSRRPGWKFRFPHPVKNNPKSVISIYDFVTFWSEATDCSFSQLLNKALYENPGIQCMYEAVPWSTCCMYSIQDVQAGNSNFHTLSKTASKQLFLFMILSLFGLRRPMALFPGIWGIHIYREPHTMYVHFTIQRMRLSLYSVCASPHTMYVWRRIQCTYKTVTQRTFLAKKSWKNIQYVQYVELKEPLKKRFY